MDTLRALVALEYFIRLVTDLYLSFVAIWPVSQWNAYHAQFPQGLSLSYYSLPDTLWQVVAEY
jgi:hypothetical protein